MLIMAPAIARSVTAEHAHVASPGSCVVMPDGRVHSALNPLFVYIRHEECPPSTIALWNAPSAGRTMSRSNCSATTTSKAALTPNCTGWPNRLAAGLPNMASSADRGWPFWPTIIRAGSRPIWESSLQAAPPCPSIPHCTTIKSRSCSRTAAHRRCSSTPSMLP